LQNAIANGDTRAITMHHLHTKENIAVTFKRNGRYDEAALKRLNWFLRDWRHDKETRMDPRLIDLMWEVNREVGGTQAIQIICGYRDESTNSMLRRRSKGVAQNSLHMGGMAMDFAIPGVPLSKLRVAGLRLQRGGVGFYPSSGSPFVHMDIGGVRHWPRMTREQLVRVFPSGRTVHIPSDGKPLSGYALALADVEQQGGSPSNMSIAAAQDAGIDTNAAASAPRRNLLASIFGFNEESEADEDKPAADAAPARVAVASAAPTGPIPLPKTRPVRQAPVVVAAALPPVRPDTANEPTAVSSANTKGMTLASASISLSPSPSEIIRTRGYWVGVPETAAPQSTSSAKLAAYAAPPADDPITTGSLPSEWLAPSANAAVADQRLAYAPFSERHGAVAHMPSRTVVMRSAETATSIAVKAGAGGGVAASHARAFDPWLNAVAITPSVRSYLASTQYGTRDFRSLRPFFDKPASAVVMAFSTDPHRGLRTDRFSGHAVVFVGTVTFAANAFGMERLTASLR
jgi:uncharacterized protein YcbK (DUF882 family)